MLSSIFCPRFSGPQNSQRVPSAIFKWLDGSGDFQDTITNSVETVRTVSFGEQLSFNDASPIGDSDEFHRFTGNLVKETLLDDQTAGDDLLSKIPAQPVHRAISFPGNVRIEFEWVAADRVPQQFFFGPQMVQTSGLG